jgi:adenylate cyclase
MDDRMYSPLLADSGPVVSADAVRRELARILASPEFRDSPQLADFLQFVVEEALAGRQKNIKQYTIATRALGRAGHFNPKSDPIVRVSAHRLRAVMAEYYRRAGASAEIRIQIPVGQYTPVFDGSAVADAAESISMAAPPRPEHQPSIAILPFAGVDRDCAHLACALTEQVAFCLTRSPDYRVLGPWPQAGGAEVRSVADGLGRSFAVRFVIDGSVCACGGDLRVTARLFDSRTARNLWAEAFRHRGWTFHTADRIAARIATAVAGPWGAIPLAIARETHDRSPAELALYEAAIHKEHWLREFTAESLTDTIGSLQRAVQACPGQARPRAWLAWAYLDDFAHGMGVADRHFARVDDLLTGSLQAEPDAEAEVRCMKAYLHFLRRERPAALREHEAAWRADPHDPATNIVFAADACALGDWDRGLTLIRDVMDQTPQYPDWLHLIPAVHCYVRGRYEESLSEADRCHTEGFAWSPLCRAAALGQLGRIDEAAGEMRRLLMLVPNFRTRAPELLRRILYSDRSVKRMLDGLAKAAGAWTCGCAAT